MPLLRYFLFVGGALLALLLVTSSVLPKPPANDTTLASAVDLPVIRIHSNKKPPPAIVYDTNAPMFQQTMVAKAKIANPARVASATETPNAENAAAENIAAKARVREAFAQLPREESASHLKMSEMAQATLPEPKMYRVKRRPTKRRLAARAHPGHPMMLVAQQPRFGFGLFGNTW